MPPHAGFLDTVSEQFAAEPFVSLEFLITSLIVVVSPGTGVLYTLAVGAVARLARPASLRRSAARSASCRTWLAAMLGLAARAAHQRAGVRRR